MKLCTHCKTKKEKSTFPFHSVEGVKYLNSWCRECCKQVQREKYQANPEVGRKKALAWQRRNIEKVKQIRRATNWKNKLLILNHYGGKCKCCGEKNPKFLSIDHINNDGHRTRAQNGRSGVASFYYWIKKNGYPKDLQVLCYNCNMAKAFYKICPHKE